MATDMTSPRLDTTQEVRFAVVMYGGVSLAIYINGVAQEILRLVRSTAPPTRDGLRARPLPPGEAGSPGATERVYRKLSYLLSDERLLAQYRADLAQTQETRPEPDRLEEQLAANRPIRTRFVVDILSGTSAGGINAIYLAKALANDQEIAGLETLWIDEGDIASLINDPKSITKGVDVPIQRPPPSLLNSRRMYARLLDAFDDMEGGQRDRPPYESPFVEELDLFITATDIEGVALPLQLSDRVVFERRHRNVFHFKYATEEATGSNRNDLAADHNPFLAFAARCTSAFPFAFAPMRLCDVDDVLHARKHYHNRVDCHSRSERWQRFFKESLDPRTGEREVSFPKRSFGDGGYLDNKPFSYATETLLRRQAPVPVDRKLIYIEPAPEHPETESGRDARPDALANVKAALLDLPRYETIREDLQWVLQRNRLIGRVNRITDQIEQDIERYEAHPAGRERRARPKPAGDEHNRMDLAEMIETYSIYYLPYRRLRIAAVTDEIAGLLARVANFDEESDYFMALRYLVRAWRELTYDDYAEEGKRPINEFLHDYDFSYRIRRLHLVRNRIDRLYRLVGDMAEREHAAAGERPELGEAEARIVTRLREDGLDLTTLNDKQREDVEHLLALLKCELNEVYKELRAVGRELRKPLRAPAAASLDGGDTPAAGGEEGAEGTSFIQQMAKLPITSQHLRYVLDGRWEGAAGTEEATQPQSDAAANPMEAEGMARARALLQDSAPFELPELQERLRTAADTLGQVLKQIFDRASQSCTGLLTPERDLPPFGERCLSLLAVENADFAPEHVRAIRSYLWRYYVEFEHYDQIRFPIFYDTEVGESDLIEVVRVSPEDATQLIDEAAERRREAEDGERGRRAKPPRRKLAGTSLHNFGAFLDRRWRQNDILWGRLDGAERLITALLPEPRDAEVRQRLIAEAHTAILREARAQLELLHAQATNGAEGRGARATPSAAGAPAPRDAPVDEALLEHMRTTYDVNRDLEPRSLLGTVVRSTRVTRRLLQGIADQHGENNRALAGVARVGQVLAGAAVGVSAGLWLAVLAVGNLRRGGKR